MQIPLGGADGVVDHARRPCSVEGHSYARSLRSLPTRAVPHVDEIVVGHPVHRDEDPVLADLEALGTSLHTLACALHKHIVHGLIIIYTTTGV